MILSLLLSLGLVEPVSQATPAKLLSGAVTTGDYPVTALADDAQGLSKLRLRIEIDGSASSCEVAQSSGHPILDAKGCEVTLERTRFSPATDADGHPVATTVILPVRWKTAERQKEETE